MKKKLNITVSGQSGSGKSRLTFLLKEFLREQGFEVEQELNIDHSTESNFDKAMGQDFEGAIEYIKGSRKITINELQLSRNYIN